AFSRSGPAVSTTPYHNFPAKLRSAIRSNEELRHYTANRNRPGPSPGSCPPPYGLRQRDRAQAYPVREIFLRYRTAAAHRLPSDNLRSAGYPLAPFVPRPFGDLELRPRSSRSSLPLSDTSPCCRN